jgi:hypothetical protein
VETALTVATLTIGEGSNAADTAVGQFKVELDQHASGIRDEAGNEASFDPTAPTDKAAPAPIADGLELIETGTRDGKVDEVKVTFSENLAGYTAANAPWTLSFAPSGTNTLVSNGVSVTDNVATLTLTQGAVNTSAGTWTGTTFDPFTITLGENDNGIRDAHGNKTSFTNRAVTDKANPIPTVLTFDPNGATTGNSTPSIDDKILVAFSEPLSVESMCDGGTEWANDLAPQVLNGNGGANVILQLQNNTAPTTSNDYFVVNAPGGGKCTTAFRFGTFDLGTQGYLTGTTASRNFNGNNANESRIDWSFDNRQLTLELGTASGALTAVANPGSAVIYAPTAAMKDRAGNDVLGTATNNGAGNTRF